MTSGGGQLERTVRVLNLLDDSFTAHARGNSAAADAAIREAARTDPLAFTGIQMGLVIGEIPNPEADPDGWARYVQATRDQLDGDPPPAG